MPVVRVYLPVGRADLDELASGGAVTASSAQPRPAFAVTPALQAQGPGLDAEDLEYAAFSEAVAAAGAARADGGDRRVVIAADADPRWVSSDVVVAQHSSPSAVALVDAVPLSRLASFHVDEEAGEPDDGDADDLLWYDVTELDEVRGLVR